MCFIKQLILCLLIGFVGVAGSRAESAPWGKAYIYKKVLNRELKLYIAYPPGWSALDKRPAVVIFHGGGWTKGGPWLFNSQSQYLASRGLVCVQVEYRLLDKSGVEPPETCIQDARSAMRWVRGHAKEIGVDPERIAAAGSSAGGHLAAAVGMIKESAPSENSAVSEKPQALVLYNPVIDNGPSGYGSKRVGQRYPEFSPFHNVTSDAPPTLILTGDQDRLVPAAMIKEFQARMEKAGVRCDLHLYPGQAHGFYRKRRGEETYYAKTLLEVDKFLSSLGWLTGEPTIVITNTKAAAPGAEEPIQTEE